MATGILDRQTEEPEFISLEKAWSVGEKGRTPLVLAAARARGEAEAAYEMAVERARNERTPEASQSACDLARVKEEAQQIWRDLYRQGERVRVQAEQCWEATKQEMMARRARRP